MCLYHVWYVNKQLKDLEFHFSCPLKLGYISVYIMFIVILYVYFGALPTATMQYSINQDMRDAQHVL